MAICRQTDRQMDIVNSDFYFRFNFANQYALLWTPNAYWDILMHIFTHCLFFQCVFTNFQCVIMLLRALSVALIHGEILKKWLSELCEKENRCIFS